MNTQQPRERSCWFNGQAVACVCGQNPVHVITDGHNEWATCPNCGGIWDGHGWNALKPKDPPDGCQEIPGYIVEVVSGVAWLTKDGFVTVKWEERGVWKTPREAQEAGNKSLLVGLPPNKP